MPSADWRKLPDDLLHRVLVLLNQSDLAAMRLTCKSFKRQPTLLVTSVKTQLLNQSPLRFLSRFPSICELQASGVLNVRLSPQLKSLVLMSEGMTQPVSSLTALSNLTQLWVQGSLWNELMGAALTSLRCLSLHSAFTDTSMKEGIAAFPMLQTLSICAVTVNLRPLSSCRHLTALHLGAQNELSALASLKDLECLSLSMCMCTVAMSRINSLSGLSKLQEFHLQHNVSPPSDDSVLKLGWQHNIQSCLGHGGMETQYVLGLPQLTCLMLNGPLQQTASLVQGLKRIAGLQALGIFMYHGELTLFSSIAEDLRLQSFKATRLYPEHTMQSGRDLTSMSRAPQAWKGQWKMPDRTGSWPPCRPFCRCTPAP